MVTKTKLDFYEIIFIISQIFAYILAAIIVFQIIKIIFGGSWSVEEAILALVVLNITVTFGLYMKIANIDKRLHGHFEWHRGIGGSK